MSNPLQLAAEKWKRKTLGRKALWVKMIRQSESKTAFISGVADFLGLSEATVRSSMPAKAYAEFQANAERYAEKFARNVRKAAEQGKWSRKLKAAFST